MLYKNGLFSIQNRCREREREKEREGEREVGEGKREGGGRECVHLVRILCIYSEGNLAEAIFFENKSVHIMFGQLYCF